MSALVMRRALFAAKNTQIFCLQANSASTSTVPGNIKVCFISSFRKGVDTFRALLNLQVFDRNLKRRQRNWAACEKDFDDAQTLRAECGYRIADRVFDLTKFNEICVDLGCGAGFIAPHLIAENVGTLIQCDMSEAMVSRSAGAPKDEVCILFQFI